jgi:AcrR family transcriptional regulator
MPEKKAAAKKSPANAPRSRLESARDRMYHDLIFEAAEEVFGAKGFEHATMQEIAQQAGVSLKTLYGTFPGKTELYHEIQRVRGEEFVARVAEATVGLTDPSARIAHTARAYAEYLLEHNDWLRINLHERIAWGLGPKTEVGGAAWRDGIANLVGIVEQGVSDGLFHAGDSETAAMMCLALMQVQVTRAIEGGATDAEAVGREIETQLLRLLCIEAPEANAAA